MIRLKQILTLIWTFLLMFHRGQTGAFTLVAWQESVDPDAALTGVKACADQHVAVSGDKIYVPSLNKLIAEYGAQANDVDHLQFQSPSLRRVALLDIPIVQGGTTPSGDESFRNHVTCPLELAVGEGLEVKICKPADSTAVATILAWFADGAITPVVGEIFTVKFTATITSVLSQWVNGAITLGQTLPVGRYAIVGAKVGEQGGDLVAYRFVVAGYQWRAGGLASGSMGSDVARPWLYGGMGIWAEFDSSAPPTLDIIAVAAASQTVIGYIQLMKIG